MTAPTAPLTTAAEMARDFLVDNGWVEHATGAVWPADVQALAAFLTTYAAQVRRDTIEDAARFAESMIEEAWSKGETPPRGITVLEAIRALPPGSPSSQTDTGDSNG